MKESVVNLEAIFRLQLYTTYAATPTDSVIENEALQTERDIFNREITHQIQLRWDEIIGDDLLVAER